MTVPSLSELFAPLTRDQVVDSQLAIAVDLGFPVTAWQETGIARELIYINAQTCASFSETTSAAARGGYLDYATGAWLTLLANQLWAVDRIESTSATGPIKLVNSLATPHTLAAGDVRILNNTTGKTYTSTTGGTLLGSGNLTLDYIADEPGSASNLTSSDSLSLVTSIPGVTAVWVSDLVGQDEESDTALRTRCRESNASPSPNGPADAYAYYAKSTLRSDGTSIGVTRTNVVESNGTVTVYVADGDGTVVSGDVALIQANIVANVVPTGFTAITTSAIVHPITIELTLTKSATATADNASLESLVTAAITGYFSGVPVGGIKTASFKGIFLSSLVTLARAATGESVVNAVVTNPGADVVLAANEVPTVASIAYTWVTV